MSGPARRRSATKSAGMLPGLVTPGSMDTGRHKADITDGLRAAGNSLPMKAHIGAIRTMTTKDRVGACTKATGTMRTTAITITTTMATATITDVKAML